MIKKIMSKNKSLDFQDGRNTKVKQKQKFSNRVIRRRIWVFKLTFRAIEILRPIIRGIWRFIEVSVTIAAFIVIIRAILGI